MKFYLKTLLLIVSTFCYSQNNTLVGTIFDNSERLSYVNIYMQNTKLGTSSNEDGYYQIKNIPSGTYKIVISSLGYKTKIINITFSNNQKITRNFSLKSDNSLDEIVISGTLRPVSKSASSVPVEVYSKAFFKKNRLGYLKTKANGEDFNTSFNNIERDMFARLKRTIPGEEQVEFKRIKGLIEQSIDVLKEASLDEKAKLYEEVYDKILKDSDNISEVESKVDKTNAEAVRWMINEWSKFYPKLNELNVNIYNKILNKEVDYTPVTFSSIEKTEKIGEIGEPILEFSLKKISDKKTGVLMEALRPTQLPKGRYLNL